MPNNQVQYKLEIYAIFDRKSGKYDTPFFAMSQLFATRRFLIMKEEPKSPLAMWPEDFELHKIGNFDCDEGDLTQENIVVLQGHAKEI